MKKIFFLCFLFVVLGCSSDDSADPVTPEQPQQQDPEPSYTFKINGVETHVDISSTVENNGNIQIGLDPAAGDMSGIFYLSFNKNGQFGKLALKISNLGVTKTFTSFRNYNSKFFEFKIFSIDETKKRVKFEVAGYLYSDPDNLNSESKYVEGTFDVNYTGLVAPVFNVGNTANIDGSPWVSTSNYALRGPNATEYYHYSLHTLSNDQYKIIIRFDRQNTQAGPYDFTNDGVNRVQVFRYDLDSHSYINYNCTGTLEVTQLTTYFIQGKYHFNGVNVNNPTDIIHVTEGNFKLEFPRY